LDKGTLALKRAMWKWFLLLLIPLILASCDRGQSQSGIPTRASIEEIATQVVLTENAPPEGWRDAVSFPQVDAGLRELAGWRYVVTLEFDGVFAGTSRRVTHKSTAQMWFNQLPDAQRVELQVSSELRGQPEEELYEGVRIGPDAYLVRDGVCLSDAGQDALTLMTASSAAGSIGGVMRAVPAAVKGIINGEQVWRYDFTLDDLALAQIELGDNARIYSATGELWVAPEHGVVIRYYLTLDVENAVIFGYSLPVTGTVILRYDLYDIVDSAANAPNISVPFGC
jgi:hypothetical protein